MLKGVQCKVGVLEVLDDVLFDGDYEVEDRDDEGLPAGKKEEEYE